MVNAGDTLMTYDTSMIELDLETQQLQLFQFFFTLLDFQ